MARGRPKKQKAPSTEISADALKAVVKEFQKHSAEASEAAGVAGQAIKNAIDRHNLDRKAFRFALGLAKADPAKRQTTLRSLIEYAHKLDMFADVDAFDDVLSRMEEIVDEVRGRTERKADPIVAATVN